MMLIIIFLKNFKGFQSKQLFLPNLYQLNLFFIIQLMVNFVEIRRNKRGQHFFRVPLLLILTFIAYLGFSFQYQIQMLNEISLLINQLIIPKSSNCTIWNNFFYLHHRNTPENQSMRHCGRQLITLPNIIFLEISVKNIVVKSKQQR